MNRQKRWIPLAVVLIGLAATEALPQVGHADRPRQSKLGYKLHMPVTCSVFPERARAELMVTDPYTFTDFRTAMRVILDTPVLPPHFRILIDRRSATRPTNSFVSCVVDFCRANEAHLAGMRAAALVSRSVPPFLPDLRVGRFRIRAFHEAAEAEQWLSSDAERPSMPTPRSSRPAL